MKSLMKIASVFMAVLLAACGTPPVRPLPVQPLKADWDWKKWNPIWWAGNDDDAPPQGYSSFGWFLRNPFHNFMFYVLGLPMSRWRVGRRTRILPRAAGVASSGCSRNSGSRTPS